MCCDWLLAAGRSTGSAELAQGLDVGDLAHHGVPSSKNCWRLTQSGYRLTIASNRS